MKNKPNKFRSEWGDSIDITRTKPLKARPLKSQKLNSTNINNSRTTPLVQHFELEAFKELKEQWDEVSQDLTRATNFLVKKVDHLAAETIREGTNYFILFTNFLLKLLFYPIKLLIKLFKTIPKELNRPTNTVKQQIKVLPNQSQITESASKPKITFSYLARQGIFFYTVNKELLGDLTIDSQLSETEEEDLFNKAILEIKSCSRLAEKLPSPPTGPFANLPMVQILQSVNKEYLEKFLNYVSYHPKPFLENKIRIAEAYATWAYKGAPET